MDDRVFLDSDLIKNRDPKGRCIVCLEQVYVFWFGENQPSGCPDNHTDKTFCKHAITRAEMRALGIKAVLETPPAKEKP